MRLSRVLLFLFISRMCYHYKRERACLGFFLPIVYEATSAEGSEALENSQPLKLRFVHWSKRLTLLQPLNYLKASEKAR